VSVAARAGNTGTQQTTRSVSNARCEQAVSFCIYRSGLKDPVRVVEEFYLKSRHEFHETTRIFLTSPKVERLTTCLGFERESWLYPVRTLETQARYIFEPKAVHFLKIVPFMGGNERANAASPEGTKESPPFCDPSAQILIRFLPSLRDFFLGAAPPAMNRWAITRRPRGTRGANRTPEILVLGLRPASPGRGNACEFSAIPPQTPAGWKTGDTAGWKDCDTTE
jgi:hypothetical protein